jgi:hypothetical protein
MTEAEVWIEKTEVITKKTEIGNEVGSVADTDPAFHSDADPDPTFQSDADPDPNTHFFPDMDSLMRQNDPLKGFHLFT